MLIDVMDYYGSLWIIMDYYGSLWIIMDHSTLSTRGIRDQWPFPLRRFGVLEAQRAEVRPGHQSWKLRWSAMMTTRDEVVCWPHGYQIFSSYPVLMIIYNSNINWYLTQSLETILGGSRPLRFLSFPWSREPQAGQEEAQVMTAIFIISTVSLLCYYSCFMLFSS